MNFSIENNLNQSLPKIAVLGCGWLGLPLAEQLLTLGYKVNGSTTTEHKLAELSYKNISPFLIDLNPDLNIEYATEFFNVDILIVNIPPKLRSRDGSYHLTQIDNVLQAVKKSTVRNIIFISSTSVYPDLNREVKESDVENLADAESKTFFEVETKIRSLKTIPHLIIRCAGLIGYDRILINHFAGKQNLAGGAKPVNLIHRDDVIEIICQLINKDSWNHTLNICAPLHPNRKDFYTHLAERYNFEMPYFSMEKSDFKIIGIEKLQSLINYTFVYPDPILFE